MKIKHILSDLDGVIRLFPIERDLKIEKKYNLPNEVLFKSAFQNELLELAISGIISDQVLRANILSKLKMITNSENVFSAFNEWNDFPGIVNEEYLNYIIQHLKGLNISILTNGTDRLNKDLEVLNIKDHFYKKYNSSEIGHFKPSKEVFQHVLADLKLLPGEILFIDDSKSHIEAANELDFQTILYQSFDSFVQQFVRYNV